MTRQVALPDSPLDVWADATLKETFARQYERVILGGTGGWMYLLSLHAMRDELHERGYNADDVLFDRGVTADDIDYEEVDL